jgi:hypothetical protein
LFHILTVCVVTNLPSFESEEDGKDEEATAEDIVTVEGDGVPVAVSVEINFIIDFQRAGREGGGEKGQIIE